MIDSKLADQKRDTRELTEHARDWETSGRVVALSSGQSELVPLWLPNAGSDGGAGCSVDVKLVQLEKRRASLSVTPRGCPADVKAPPTFDLEKGGSHELGDLHLVATLADIDRPWFSPARAHVRLSGTGRSCGLELAVDADELRA